MGKSDWNERRLCDVNWNEDRFGPYAQYMYGVLTMAFGHRCNLRIVLIHVADVDSSVKCGKIIIDNV